VDGSSTGILEVSAIIMISSERNIIIKAELARGNPMLIIVFMICGSEVDLQISPIVKTEMRIDGSIKDEIIASRLLPIPPKVLPVSSAADIIKNLPRAKIEKSMIASPGMPCSMMRVETGTSKDAATADEKKI